MQDKILEVYIKKIFAILLLALLITACVPSITTELTPTPYPNTVSLPESTDGIPEMVEIEDSQSAPIVTLQWKAIFMAPGDAAHLCLTVNGEDYYVGHYWPMASFMINENLYDAPEDALTTLTTRFTGEGQCFTFIKNMTAYLLL